MSSHGATKEMAVEGPREPKRPTPKLEHIVLSKAENGGVIAEHRMSSYAGPEKKFVFGEADGQKLANHLGSHLGHDGLKALGRGENDEAGAKEE